MESRGLRSIPFRIDTVKKTKSPYILVKESSIHSRGVFAKKDIPEGTRIIEYVGEKITHAESICRAEMELIRAKKDKSYGAVYLFELNKRHDIDGNVPYNTARLINHSCDPNCETDIIGGHIWVMAIRDINKSEELTYNYGYNFDDYEDHQCVCGTHLCVGYILGEEHWSKLKRAKAKAKLRKKNKRFLGKKKR